MTEGRIDVTTPWRTACVWAPRTVTRSCSDRDVADVRDDRHILTSSRYGTFADVGSI